MRKLILPYPDKALSPNRKNGSHWGKTNAIKKDAINTAIYAAKVLYASEKPVSEATPLNITFVQADKRHRDLDNLLSAMKPSLDGLAQGMGINDKLFQPITIQRGYDTVSYTVIEIG